MMPQAIYCFDGYVKSRELDGWYRDLTVQEAKAGPLTIYAIDRHGYVRHIRLNGKPQTWKTRPGCILSVKYGLKECYKIGSQTLTDQEAISLSHQPRVVVPVVREFAPDTPAGVVADWISEHEIG